MLAAGAAQAALTSFEILDLEGSGSCGDVRPYVSIAGAGIFACAKYTIEQDGRKAVLVDTGNNLTPNYLGYGFFWKQLYHESGTPLDDFEVSKPFTLTWSAGISTPGCDDLNGTLQVTGCKLPKILRTITTTVTPDGAGTITCDPDPVPNKTSVSCTAKANTTAGYIYDDGSITLTSGTRTGNCGGDTCTLDDVYNNVEVSATFSRKEYTVDVTANRAEVTITCNKSKVEHGGEVTCSYAPTTGWKPNLSGLLSQPADCGKDGEAAVKCTNVTGDLVAVIPFDEVGSSEGGESGSGSTGGSGTGTGGDNGSTPGGNAPGGSDDAGTGNGTGFTGGSDSSSPTMGELGLLLSGLALAGAAAPALRRRERKARKQA